MEDWGHLTYMAHGYRKHIDPGVYVCYSGLFRFAFTGPKSIFPITFHPVLICQCCIFACCRSSCAGSWNTECSRKAKISSCSCRKSPAYCRCTTWRAWALVRTAIDWRAPRNELSCIGRRWSRSTTTTTTDQLYDIARQYETKMDAGIISTVLNKFLPPLTAHSDVCVNRWSYTSGVVCDFWPRNR